MLIKDYYKCEKNEQKTWNIFFHLIKKELVFKKIEFENFFDFPKNKNLKFYSIYIFFTYKIIIDNHEKLTNYTFRKNVK